MKITMMVSPMSLFESERSPVVRCEQCIVVVRGELKSRADHVPAGLARVVTHAEQLRARGYQQMRVQRVYLPMHDWTVLARATAFSRYPEFWVQRVGGAGDVVVALIEADVGSELYPLKLDQYGEHDDMAAYEFTLVADGDPAVEADWRVSISGRPAQSIEALIRCLDVSLVAVVPIWRTDAEREIVVAESELIGDDLGELGIKTEVDCRVTMRVGEKFRDHARRGITVRVEVGPRDLERDELVIRRGDLKRTSTRERLAETVLNILTLDLGRAGMPGVARH